MDMANLPPPRDEQARRLRFSFADQDGRFQSIDPLRESRPDVGHENPHEAWRDGLDMPLLISKLKAQRRFLWRSALVGSVTGLALMMLWVTLLRGPSWSATSEVLVANTTLQLSGQDAVVTQLMVENTLLQSQMLLARSHTVLERAIERIGASETEALLPQPGLLGRFLASLRANTALRATSGQSVTNDQSARQGLLLSLKSSVTVARSGASQIITLRARGADPDAAVRLASEVTQAFIAESRAINAVVTTSGAFRERIQVLGPTVRQISEPLRPQGKDGPRALLLLTIAPLLGALAGLGAALMAALLSRNVWSPEQLCRHVGGEFFGHVPEGTHRASKHKNKGRPNAQASPDLPVVLRRIRAAALEKRRNRPRIVGITCASGNNSSGAGRGFGRPLGQGPTGKTTVAKGLALLLAQSGQRVLLADAAFETRQLTQALGLEGQKGLLDVLREPELLPSAIHTSLETNLDLMSSGLGDGDADALWPALPRALAAMTDRPYDWVILDLAPLAPASAIRAAGIVVDDLVLVVRRGAVCGNELDMLTGGLGASRGKLLGSVFGVTSQQGWWQTFLDRLPLRRRASPGKAQPRNEVPA